MAPLFKESNVTYKIAKYSALLEWNSSDVQNYTLTLTDDNEIILQSENVDANTFNYSLLNLNYSINYSLQIYGSNCAGKGNSQVLFFFEGIIENYYSAKVTEDEIFFFSWLYHTFSPDQR